MKTINFFSTFKFLNIYILWSLLFCLTYVLIHFSPTLISAFQPDSQTYIDFDMTRTSIYPSLIKYLSELELNLFIFQKLILSLSIILLLYSLRTLEMGITTILIFYSILILNFFYTTFTKTVLTEALFCSFINFSFAIFILNKKKNNFFNFILGLSIGFIITIKTIGFAVGLFFLSILLLVYFREKLLKKFSIILVGTFLVICFEHILFFKKHSERKSVLPIAIVGKVFFLSGNDSFDEQKFPLRFREILLESKSAFRPVLVFLQNIRNPILKSDLTSDYEVVAQYQFLKFKIPLEKRFNERKIFDSSNELLIPLLRYNLKEYFLLSLTHYLGMWSTNSKEIFLEKYLEEKSIDQPLAQEFKNASGGIKKLNSNLLLISQIIFLGFFLFFIFVTIYTVYLILTKNFFNNIFLISSVSISQIYLILVSLSNVSTIRYLMPIYPLILLSFIFFIFSLKRD